MDPSGREVIKIDGCWSDTIKFHSRFDNVNPFSLGNE